MRQTSKITNYENHTTTSHNSSRMPTIYAHKQTNCARNRSLEINWPHKHLLNNNNFCSAHSTRVCITTIITRAIQTIIWQLRVHTMRFRHIQVYISTVCNYTPQTWQNYRARPIMTKLSSPPYHGKTTVLALSWQNYSARPIMAKLSRSPNHGKTIALARSWQNYRAHPIMTKLSHPPDHGMQNSRARPTTARLSRSPLSHDGNISHMPSKDNVSNNFGHARPARAVLIIIWPHAPGKGSANNNLVTYAQQG